MVGFKILSGKQAGNSWAAPRYPAFIGRSPTADLQLEEDGVWDQHLQLDILPAQGFVLNAKPDALATINGQPVHQTVLRNGDIIQIGLVQLQFFLAETRQSGLRIREALTWAGIAIISLGQVAVIYWLLR
jgi:hypothetical protein